MSDRCTADLPEALQGRRQLAPDERFPFACHSGLACFNRCCADVTIFLTPLDVLRLSRAVGLTTTDFILAHTVTPVTKDLQLPVVLLKMGEAPEKSCPFVGPKGCTVYASRPWACRMYPVGMAVPPARAGVEPKPAYFLFEDDFCLGRSQDGQWTVEAWRKDQGAGEHEHLEKGFRDLVSHPWFIGGRKLNVQSHGMLFTACYDLDTFRRFVFHSSFLNRFDIEDDLVKRLENDDLALLGFAFRWLRFALFAEPTIKVKKGARPVGRKE